MVLEADKIIEKERIERENKMRKMMGMPTVEEEEAKQQCRSGCVRLLGANRCASRILTFTRQAKRMRATD